MPDPQFAKLDVSCVCANHARIICSYDLQMPAHDPVFCALGNKNRTLLLLLYSRFFFCSGLTNKTKFPFKCIGKSDIKTSLGSHYISANTKCFPLKDKKGVSEWRCNKAVKARDTVCVFQHCIYSTDKVLYSFLLFLFRVNVKTGSRSQ